MNGHTQASKKHYDEQAFSLWKNTYGDDVLILNNTRSDYRSYKNVIKPFKANDQPGDATSGGINLYPT
jgi:hypothetical protein